MSKQNKAGNELCLTGGVERKNNNLCQLVMVSSNDLQEIYHTQVTCSSDTIPDTIETRRDRAVLFRQLNSTFLSF